MAEARTRWQKVLDSAIVGGAGTLAAALILGILTGSWAVYTGIQRVETMQKAMNLVISEKLSQVDSGRIDELEDRLAASEAARIEDMEFILDLLPEDSGTEYQHVQQQELEVMKPEPSNGDEWRKRKDRQRETQEQIQQQYELLK